MGDGVFWAILYTGTAFDTCIDVGRCGFTIDNFKDIRGAHIFADGSPRTFIIVDFEGEIPFFILPCFYGHYLGTPLPGLVVVFNDLLGCP